LREDVEDAAAEDADRDPQPQRRRPEVQPRPDEVDDDAEVGQLDREPHVGAAGRPLEPVAARLDDVEQGRVDVSHRPPAVYAPMTCFSALRLIAVRRGVLMRQIYGAIALAMTLAGPAMGADLPVLEPDHPIERALAGGETHAYQIALPA